MKRIFKNWLGYAAVLTLLCGIIFYMGRQEFRQSANDPQLQLVQEAANALNKGADPKSLVGTGKPAEISETQAPYIVIYDVSGNVVANSGVLNGRPLKVPRHVIDYIQKNGADKATWEPVRGVSQAMVALLSNTTHSYVVIGGRS